MSEHKSAYRRKPQRTEETRRLENERNSLKHELQELRVRYLLILYQKEVRREEVSLPNEDRKQTFLLAGEKWSRRSGSQNVFEVKYFGNRHGQMWSKKRFSK